MITILYPFRNRELFRVKNSLNSLAIQSNLNFKVLFVDYGSSPKIATEVKNLLNEYDFVDYLYSYHIEQPWSRSKAINIGLKNVKTDFVFIADIDLLFHKDFVALLQELKNPTKSIYFQVGYLADIDNKEFKPFDDYNIISKSIPEGQGLSLFSMDALRAVNGFDEFFHFWGAEDEDIHSRLRNFGLSTVFFDTKIYLLHQWHPVFNESNDKKLTDEPKISNIFNFNKQKLRFNQKNNLINVNFKDWGKMLTKDDYEILTNETNRITLINKKSIVDHFINIILPNTHESIISVRFQEDSHQHSLKYKFKRMLRMTKIEYCSLKNINDLILLQLISHYRDYPYCFKINTNKKTIDFSIKK